MKIGFTRVVLIDFSRKAKEGTAHFSASLTRSVIDTMGWGEALDWQQQITPAGRLLATKVELVPKSDDIAKHALSLDTTLIDGFEIIRKEADGKTAKKLKSKTTKLTFTVHFSDMNGCRKLEQFFLAANDGGGMTVTYEKEPEQATLEEAPAESKQGQLEELVEETLRKRKSQ